MNRSRWTQVLALVATLAAAPYALTSSTAVGDPLLRDQWLLMGCLAITIGASRPIRGARWRRRLLEVAIPFQCVALLYQSTLIVVALRSGITRPGVATKLWLLLLLFAGCETCYWVAFYLLASSPSP